MSENDSMDHWERLASELGAEPSSREPEEQPGSHDKGGPPAGDSAEPELAAQLPLSSLPPKKKKAPPDWGAIASALGIMAAPEVDEPSPASGRGDASPEKEAGTAEFIEEARQEFEAGAEEEDEAGQDEEVVVEPPDEAAETPWGLDTEGTAVPFAPELQAPPPEVREEPFGFGLMPTEEKPSAPADVDAAEPPAGQGEAAPEAAAELPDKGPSRRRRRRRRKPRLGEKADEGPEVEPQEDESGEAVAGDVDTEEAESVELEEEARGGDEVRGKRRRKRRPAKRKKKGEAEPAAPSSRSPEAGTAAALGDEEDTAAKPDRDEAARPSRKADGQKPSHRAIPTWGEAVGLIISGNLERRKKSGGGSDRGRGRGRGRKGRSSSEGRPPSRR